MGHSDAQLAKLRVITRDLLKTGLDVANVGDLRAEVKVNQLEDVQAPERLEPVHQLHQLRGAETELRLLAAAFRPAARTLGVELDPHTRRRHHPELVGNLEQNVDLAELLQNDEDLVAE